MGVDFVKFDERAKAGARLSVVFLGGSLTWGGNASDPQLTSYRARFGQRLIERYPDAHFTFWDAAIGGTSSQLAAFRLVRDVMRRKPDLVLIDFIINDGPESVDVEKLSSYEALVRRAIVEAGALVEVVILPIKKDVEPNPPPRPRDAKHKEIAEAYHAAVGDAVTWVREAVQRGRASGDELWPYEDGVHPGDRGYALYAEAVWIGFLQAIQEKRVCQVPEKSLFGDTYLRTLRQRLSQLEPLPEGWTVGRPNTGAVAYDFYMSRWLDDVTIASAAAKPWHLQFLGSTVLLFGEGTPASGKCRVLIDGRPAAGSEEGIFNMNSAGGNSRYVGVLAEGLDHEKWHTLEIVPLLENNQVLRIESVCVAGGRAEIKHLEP